jgi:hypothetical protein
MQLTKQLIVAGALIAGVILAAVMIIQIGSGNSKTAAETPKDEPAIVEHIEGSELSRVTLSQRAAERLGIETVQVVDKQVDGVPRQVIPYGAVIYDADGKTWTYTNPEPLVFLRHEITIERIENREAVLSSGPTAGTSVVNVGAALLFGAEHGVGH